MSHRKRRPPVILPQITAQTMVAEGKAMAFVDGKVLFIEGVVPGDVVDVRITKNKPDYAIGEAVSIITPSKERQNPFCAHFGSCGGCKWQHISYEQQLQYKSQIVADA
nr:TRAM domain-containing protein [Chitinophagales bacterium]